MTRAFERFLRSFSDDDLVTFARERGEVRPPYWRAMQVALRIEYDRRGLRTAEDWTVPPSGGASTRRRGASAWRGDGVANGA